jgi:gas vesicle protein
MGKSKFIVGALLGAAAAALLTPVSGKGARTKVKKAALKVGLDTNKLESQVGQLAKQGKGIIGSVIQKAEERVKTKTKKK